MLPVEPQRFPVEVLLLRVDFEEPQLFEEELPELLKLDERLLKDPPARRASRSLAGHKIITAIRSAETDRRDTKCGLRIKVRPGFGFAFKEFRRAGAKLVRGNGSR